MKKLTKIAVCVLIAVAFAVVGTLLMQRHALGNDLIRLHVVAASDSAEDQAQKLLVRDAVIASMEDKLAACSDVTQAKACLQENLSYMETVANDTLKAAGSSHVATVSFCREAFPIRHYDTFSLPSGVYQSLRITIGQGQGQNWWCVVFPSFCIGAASNGFAAQAAGAGFDDRLTDTLEDPETYQVSFFFLDLLGKLENLFFKS